MDSGTTNPNTASNATLSTTTSTTTTTSGVRGPTAATRSDARTIARANESLRAAELHARFANTANSLRTDFATYSGGDDKITIEDLERVRDGHMPGATAEQRENARWLLENRAYLNALDTGAGRGDVDGKISTDDLDGAVEGLRLQDWSGPTIGVDGAIDSEEEALTVLGRYLTLADTASGDGGRNAHFSNDDVRALLDNPDLPDELRQAAQYIVDHDVDLPGDGSSFLGTVTSPLDNAGDWAGDQITDAGGEAADIGRDQLLDTDTLSEEERQELDEAARASADRAANEPELPLNEQNNAHHTNTREEMLEALSGDYQWLEGDIRRDPPVMAHDWQADNGLTLREWLEIGNESGRGLKLDIKEGQSVDGIIEAVNEVGVPQDRLIFNADVMEGPGGSGRNVDPEQLLRLRREFPDATIAIGATTGEQPPGTTYTEAQINEMIALAEQVGGNVMFPLRAEFVTPEIVERLSAHGTVNIWSSASTYPIANESEREAAEQRFRDMGVTGVIDIALSD